LIHPGVLLQRMPCARYSVKIDGSKNKQKKTELCRQAYEYL